MTSHELRKKYLEFFKSKGHTIIPSASLIPENDPTVLFTTAGMHPLVPYLLGEPHPGGKRLANVQKSVRTQDIDEVGDNRHDTFFEMLGNWSLGDYFKQDAIAWSWEFLTDKKWLGIDPKKLAVSVFAGDADAPRDEESAGIWESLGVPAHKIGYLPKKNNWWGPAGQTGPCGPDTEMFYWTGKGEYPPEGSNPATDEDHWLEIWNDVFMQYNKVIKSVKSPPKADPPPAEKVESDGSEYEFVPLKQKNVDTGMGLERTLVALNGYKDVFQIDTFWPIVQTLEQLSGRRYDSDPATTKSMRIIADHVRTATMIVADDRGIVPSNVDQGYVVRRLIRRAIRYARQLGLKGKFCADVASAVVEIFRDVYPEVERNKEKVFAELAKEEEKFDRTLEKGLKEFEKIFAKKAAISGEDAFILYSTYGFPLELSQELAQEKGQKIDEEVFRAEFKKHQDLSRAGATQKFSGGLADHSWEVIRQHTATHLLDQALRDVLGKHVEQKGSNITKERLRFDFTHPQKMTDEEKKRVEEIVNEKVKADLSVRYDMLTVEEAKAQNAIGLFEDKYATMGEKVKVYSIGDYSKEICGGPHVEHTAQVGKFKIVKEEAVSAGIRRIKAVVT
ncbi:alanine--tRNA ligase [Candidatus Uhrbacteria bacterium]|nr:alanine--tRNA ligase [Candidatus Uhrbacteria bacterium]